MTRDERGKEAEQVVASVNGRSSYPHYVVLGLAAKDMYSSVNFGIGAHSRQALGNPQRVGRTE